MNKVIQIGILLLGLMIGSSIEWKQVESILPTFEDSNNAIEIEAGFKYRQESEKC